MYAKPSLLFLVAALLVGCGGGGDKNGDNAIANNNIRLAGDTSVPTPDAGDEADAATPDAGTATDAATNNAQNSGNNTTNNSDPGECGDELVAGTTFPIDDGESGQLHARAAWDGEGVWVVYNRPTTATDETEDIFVARIACDQTLNVGPMALTEESGARNYMPEIASRNGVTHIVWIEQPQGGNPETVRLAAFGQSGQQLFDEPLDITPDGGEEPISGLVWEPDVVIFDDGSGAVTVSAGGFGEFKVVIQRYDSSGTRVGTAITPFTEKGVDQKRPTLAAAADGTIYVAWTRYKAEDTAAGTPEEPEQVVFTSIPAGANMAFPAAPTPAKPLTNPNPIGRYAPNPGPDGEFFLAFQLTTSNRHGILVRDGSDFESASTTDFGTQNYSNFRPSITAGGNGGLLAWYRYTDSPLRNEVVVQPFAAEGEGITAGSEVVIDTDSPGIPPYGPDVTSVGGNAYFVTWSEGETAPQSRVHGRFVVAGGL